MRPGIFTRQNMYLPIIQYDMVINSRGVMIKMGIYNIKNKAGIKQVHDMYLRCPDWARVGTTQSEIALSFPGFIWKNICQLPFYNFSVTAVLLERKKIWETVSLMLFLDKCGANAGYLLSSLIFWKITRALYTVNNHNTETNLRRVRVFVAVVCFIFHMNCLNSRSEFTASRVSKKHY